MTDTNKELDALNEALEYWEREDCIANTLDAREIFKAAQSYAKHHTTIKAIESGDWQLIPKKLPFGMIQELTVCCGGSADQVSENWPRVLSAAPKIGGE